MLKAVIFDLNGVFIQSPILGDRFREKFGVPAEKFLPALKEIMAKVRMPNVGDTFSYWEPHLKEWGVPFSREQFFDFWFSAEKESPEMTALARELKEQGMKLFVLSNNFVERAKYYEKTFPFLGEIFEKVYYSWQTGFVKPSEMAYKKLLEDNNLRPEECVYFDDSEQNIKVANGLGINSYIFEGAEKIREIIRAGNSR